MSNHLRLYLDHYGYYVSIIYDKTHPDIVTGAVIGGADFFCDLLEIDENDDFFKSQDAKRQDVNITDQEAEDHAVAICVLMNWNMMETASGLKAFFMGNEQFLEEVQGKKGIIHEYNGYLN